MIADKMWRNRNSRYTPVPGPVAASSMLAILSGGPNRRSEFAAGNVAGVPSAAVATNPPADLTLTPLNGPRRTVAQLLTNFHLCFVALDPFTNESAWILPTA